MVERSVSACSSSRDTSKQQSLCTSPSNAARSSILGEEAKPVACIPLLKFHRNEEQPHLVAEGLAALSALPPPVSVIAMLGDGRCGKSTLASRLDADESQIFAVGDTGVPVTEGIDMCVLPRRVDSAEDGSIVVLDCEGGNNPTGAIRTAVDVIAMLMSTLTVQVVWGQMSEGQLQQIGQGLAVRDRLLVGQPSSNASLPTQRLLIVVNGCHLQYSIDQLNASFLEIHHGAQEARSELRARIKRSYDKISFSTLPLESKVSYPGELGAFRRAVAASSPPVSLAGSILSGAQIAEMVKSAVRELHTAGVVPMVSVFRHVIYDHLLAPLRDKYFLEFESFLPNLSNQEYRTDLVDRRTEVMTKFDRESEHLSYTELVSEARAELADRVDRAWQSIYQQNQANGEQTRDITMEYETRFERTEERVVSWKKPCLVFGKKKPVVQNCNVFREWSRSRILKKNGQVVYSNWSPSPTPLESNPSWNGLIPPPIPTVNSTLSNNVVNCRGNSSLSMNSKLISSLRSDHTPPEHTPPRSPRSPSRSPSDADGSVRSKQRHSI